MADDRSPRRNPYYLWIRDLSFYVVGMGIMVNEAVIREDFDWRRAAFGFALATTPATLRVEQLIRLWRGGPE